MGSLPVRRRGIRKPYGLRQLLWGRDWLGLTVPQEHGLLHGSGSRNTWRRTAPSLKRRFPSYQSRELRPGYASLAGRVSRVLVSHLQRPERQTAIWGAVRLRDA